MENPSRTTRGVCFYRIISETQESKVSTFIKDSEVRDRLYVNRYGYKFTVVLHGRKKGNGISTASNLFIQASPT